MCVSMEFDGLGLKELKKLNMTKLAKQDWRLLTQANPLISAVMKTRLLNVIWVIILVMFGGEFFLWEIIKSGAR